MRKEFLAARLLALCGPAGRLVPPRGMGPAAQADELAALGRAVSSAAPSAYYEAWWSRFEDALLGGLTSRAWPTLGEIRRAAREVQSADKAGAGPTAGAEEPPYIYQYVEEWWRKFHAAGPGSLPKSGHAVRLVNAGLATWGQLWRVGFPIPDWARPAAMEERDPAHEAILADIRAMGERLRAQEAAKPHAHGAPWPPRRPNETS